jgi:hypothetical protein
VHVTAPLQIVELVLKKTVLQRVLLFVELKMMETVLKALDLLVNVCNRSPLTGDWQEIHLRRFLVLKMENIHEALVDHRMNPQIDVVGLIRAWRVLKSVSESGMLEEKLKMFAYVDIYGFVDEDPTFPLLRR